MIRFFVTIILGVVAVLSVTYMVGVFWLGYEVSKALGEMEKPKTPVKKERRYPKTKDEVKKFAEAYRNQDRGYIK